MRIIKNFGRFLASNILAGVLVITPIYLAALLLFKAMSSLMVIVKPVANIVPEWLPAEHTLSLLLVLGVCLVVGLVIRTAVGREIWDRIETNVFQRMPGYQLVRSLTQRLSGDARDNAWTPVLAEIEEALVPAFIVEVLADGRFTVFVPSVPTPLAGSIYVLTPERVHLLSVPFAEVIKVVSRWGSGTKNLVAAMEKKVTH
jgi:uncharacterized membrane protein